MFKKISFIVLLLCSFQAEAGEWFKTAEVKAGVGYETTSCSIEKCDYDYDIADGIIGKFAVSQSIYSAGKLKIEAQWDHMSGINSRKAQETPIDYFGINISIEHDWY